MLTYCLLADSMEHSFLEKLIVFYLVKKYPAQVPATCPYPEPVHVLISNFLKIHLNIILPSTPGSSKWSLFPQISLYTLFLSPIRITCPAHRIIDFITQQHWVITDQ